MRCDCCNAPLPEGYAPQVDARGRPCLAICTPCNDRLVLERAQRLGLTVPDLVDEFERHLRRVLPREVIH